ncbi:MAG: hypothetical protein V4733_12510 [Verrucomicrobiota bacterium]
MMTKHPILIACIGAILANSAPGHEKTKTAGPNGGRVLTKSEPDVEFFVLPDRRIQLTALDKNGKPAPVTTQIVTATGGDRFKPTKFAFAKQGDVLVSDQPLPTGNNTPLILQFKTTADGATVTERIAVNLADCSGCKLKEYACICDHDH